VSIEKISDVFDVSRWTALSNPLISSGNKFQAGSEQVAWLWQINYISIVIRDSSCCMTG